MKLIKYEPMFTKLCILHIYNYEINENDDNIYNCDLYLYYDANDKIINTNFVKIKTMKKYKGYKNDQNIILNAQICEIKKNGNLSLKKIQEEILSKILSSKIIELGGKKITIGNILSLIRVPLIPSSLVGSIASNISSLISNVNSKVEKEEQIKNKDIIDKEIDIDKLIKEGLENSDKLNYT